MSMLGSPEAADGVARMARVIRGSRVLQVREREILGELTNALADLIAEETGARPGQVEPWLAAHAVLGLYASLLELARDRVLAGVGGPELTAELLRQGRRGLVAPAVRPGRLRQAALSDASRVDLQGPEQLVGAVAGDVGVPGEQGDGDHVAVLARPSRGPRRRAGGCGGAPWARCCRGRSPGPWPGSWRPGSRGPRPSARSSRGRSSWRRRR